MNIRIGKWIVSPGFLLLVAFVLYFDPGWILPSSAISIFIHEAGHLLAMKYFDTSVRNIRFTATGIAIDIPSAEMRYAEEAVISASGPIASFLFAAILSVAAQNTNNTYLYMLSGLNIVYGSFNLLPIRPLDGGNLLNALLNISLGYRQSEQIMLIGEAVFTGILTISGMYLFLADRHNPTVLIIAIWLVFYCCKHSENSVEF